MPIYPCLFTSSIKWFRLNSTVLNWCLKTVKNVEKFKQRNVTILCVWTFTKWQLMFLTKCQFIHANSVHFNKLSIYPWKLTSSIKWFWLDSIVLTRCLKTLKNVKEFKQRNISVFRDCTFTKTQLMFLIVSIYPCKFTSSIKWFWLNSAVLNWCLKTSKNVKEFKQRNVSIFHECMMTKTRN